MPSPAQPPLVLPDPYGRAIDDPNTALLQRFRTRLLRRLILSVVCLLFVIALDVFAVIAGVVADAALLVALTIGLGALVGSALALHVPQQRLGKALLGRYGWRAVPANLVADKPCLARIGLDGTELTLRLTRFNRLGQQVLLRTGTLWICGPDEQGRALVRVAGSVGQALARVTDAQPTGVPPVPRSPSSPRPADDPGLIWARHVFHRSMLIILAVLVLLAGIEIGLVSRTGIGNLGTLGTEAFGQLLGTPVILIVIVWGYLVGLRQFRRFAAAPYWLPVPVSLDTWDNPANMVVRTGAGRLILPGGRPAYADFPRLPLDLAANLRATGVLWLAGDPQPGATVPIGLPGYPLRGVVKIRR
jgi:hypothetical protein